MFRMMIAASLAAAIGAALTYVLIMGHVQAPASGGGTFLATDPAPIHHPRTRAEPTVNVPEAQPARPPQEFLPPTVADLIAFYSSIAHSAPPELERQLRAFASESPGPRQRTALSGLMLRYVELDPAAALRISRELELDSGLQLLAWVPLFITNEQAVLELLATMQNRLEARAIVIAIFRAMDHDASTANRLLAGLTADEQGAARADIAVSLVGIRPRDALSQAMSITPLELMSRAVQTVGSVWSRLEPEQAFEAALRIDDRRLRETYRRAVLLQWRQTDAAAMLDYFVALDPSLQRGALLDTLSFETAINVPDPYRMIAMADGLSDDVAARLHSQAIGRIADDDPLAAIAQVNRMRLTTGARSELLIAVARSWAASSPDAAMDWALGSDEPGILNGVLAVVARSDFDSALSTALAVDGRAREDLLYTVIYAARAEGMHMPRIAQSLRYIPDDSSRVVAYQRLISEWTTVDPLNAVHWVLDNMDHLPENSRGPAQFGRIAQQLARSDLASALALIDSVPEPSRDQWVSSVASQYAQSDPERATIWALGLRGSPHYAPALVQVASRVSGQHRDRVASAIADASSTDMQLASAVHTIATSYGRDNPMTGAAWLSQLQDETLRTNAAYRMVLQWAQLDPTAASHWAQSLSEQPMREQVLHAISTARAR